jgi:hypothetical protein
MMERRRSDYGGAASCDRRKIALHTPETRALQVRARLTQETRAIYLEARICKLIVLAASTSCITPTAPPTTTACRRADPIAVRIDERI